MDSRDANFWHPSPLANKRTRKRRLWDAYAFEGFRPEATVRGVFGDPKARVITLVRRSKKHAVVSVARRTPVGTTTRRGRSATCRVAIRGSMWNSTSGAARVGTVAR